VVGRVSVVKRRTNVNVSLTSDPYAWLRSIYARLQTQPGFTSSAPSRQFTLIVDAIIEDHPLEAAQMREWSTGAQDALLLHLASSIDQTVPAAVSELWQVTKGNRRLRCVVHYLSSGLDLRLLEGQGFRQTQLCKDAREAELLSQSWRTKLLEGGWEPGA